MFERRIQLSKKITHTQTAYQAARASFVVSHTRLNQHLFCMCYCEKQSEFASLRKKKGYNLSFSLLTENKQHKSWA